MGDERFMSETYRAAIIGCGSISTAHARGYQAVEEIELVALCDLHPKALQERADEFRVRGRYRDYREMIERERPELKWRAKTTSESSWCGRIEKVS